MNGAPVEGCRFAFHSCEAFLFDRIIDHAYDRFAAPLQSDGNGVMRVAMRQLGRAVQWIYDPPISRVAADALRFYLRQNRVMRVAALQMRNDRLFGFPIGG